MHGLARISRWSLAVAMLGLAACQPIQPEAASAEPREVVVLAGAGQDTVAVNVFFPESVRVHTGDTVTWKINSDEPHTATFLSGEPRPVDVVPIPGGGPADLMLNPAIFFSTRAPDAPVETYAGTGFRNSGVLSNGKVTAPVESYSLTFDQPGTYSYNCLLHPGMVGTVEVAPAAAAVPSQEEIDAEAQAAIEPLLAMGEELRAQTTDPSLVRSEPGPGGTTIWYAPAGRFGLDPRVEVLDFFPKDLTIHPGDTVIWTSTAPLHQVIFAPGQPAPELAVPEPQEAGPPILRVNPAVAFRAKPSGEFDGVSLYSSGLMGAPDMPGGTTFALTFDDPGTYDYVCATHRALGMTGVVNVVAP